MSPQAAPEGSNVTNRLAGMLAVISAICLTLALITPTAPATAAVNTANSSIPVNPAQSIEMHATANCIAAEGRCAFDTAANLRAPEGVIGFPGDFYGRQSTTLRTMDRNVYINFDYDLVNTRSFKSPTDVVFQTVFFGGGPPEKFTWHGNAFPVDARTGQPRTDVPLIVCAHIQAVYSGVNLTTPDACAQASFS
jgi:hypothetical protein